MRFSPTLRPGFARALGAILLIALVAGGCSTGKRAPAAGEPAPTERSAVADATPGAASAEPAQESAALPLDPAVTHGTLANGMKFYIRENAKPENRAELRLVVNAGSVLEDDDQQGLAHFVEHMAFNGTKNFEKQALIDYLEKIGTRFGPDINAYTNTDETVYMLQVPTDDEEVLKTSFQILEDWAHGVTFEDVEIDKERGVVVEEWRRGRGAGARTRDKQFPVMFHGSKYADRLTIGKKEILENAPYEAFRRFYRDWYRPDLMAVVAVGDFDGETVRALIDKHFAGIAAHENPRERDDFAIPDHDDTLVSVVTDPETTTSNVTVMVKRPHRGTSTRDDYRRDVVEGLYDSMLNQRLNELTNSADPPFTFAFAGGGNWMRTKGAYRIGVTTPDGGLERGLEAVLTEAKRASEHGFTASELEREKTNTLRVMDRRLAERDKQESRLYASRYIRHFLRASPTPGVEYRHAFMKEVLPGITLEEINALGHDWTASENRVILVSAPEKEGVAVPDRVALLETFGSVRNASVEPYVDRVRDEPLVPNPPKPGKVVSEETIAELGVTKWTLSNGARVVMKPTTFKNDEVRLSGWSPGGTSLVDDTDWVSARQATAVLRDGGLGAFDRIELEKALTGKVAFVSPYIGELSEGVSGSASPQDLETMFELLYLTFTAPRKDVVAFESYRTRMATFLENQEASPGFWFSRKYASVVSQDHPRREIMSQAMLDRVDLDRALAVYRDRFADASDFVFTLVGNFDPAAIRPLVERWVAGLPSTDRGETWKDVGVRPPTTVERFEVRRGIEPKSQVRILFTGDAEWERRNRSLMSMLGQVMSIRLREILREDMGGVYGVSARGGIDRWPVEDYSFSISFGCDPERVDDLVSAVFAEIDAILESGPSEDNIRKAQEAQLRSRETALERNGWWLSQLEFLTIHDQDPRELLGFEEMVKSVTAKDVHEAAKRYFDLDRYVYGALYPEKRTVAELD